MISNLLDIDFIHGDIHGRSCKKVESLTKGAGYQWLNARLWYLHCSPVGDSAVMHYVMIYYCKGLIHHGYSFTLWNSANILLGCWSIFFVFLSAKKLIRLVLLSIYIRLHWSSHTYRISSQYTNILILLILGGNLVKWMYGCYEIHFE